MKTTDADFPAALETAAESWVGTPFKQLHATKGVGVDCANIVYACLADTGIALPDLDAPTFGKSADVNFASVIQDFLAALVEAGTIEKLADAPEIQPGDLLLYQVSRRTQHLALAVDGTNQLHVWPDRDAAIVALDAKWQRLRVAQYRMVNHG